MTEIISKHGEVSRSPFELYMMFVDLRNFRQFLPEDRRDSVTADYDTLSVTVQGFKIGVMVKERIPYSKITFIDEGGPFSFDGALHFDAVPSAPGKTDFHLELRADLNLMMKMLIGGKLREAADKVVDALVSVSEGRMPEGLDEETLHRLRREMEGNPSDC